MNTYQLGQRYIGCGSSGEKITLHTTPGNALGAYLNGSEIELFGNAQDATGDTMNSGSIVIHGNTGDTAGYAMRGGNIYVKGNAGYRTGIHMKEYHDKIPHIVIGGHCGSFLGEYQAGGVILVLGIGCNGVPVGAFCGTGMHGGRIYIRSSTLPCDLPEQVTASVATTDEMQLIDGLIDEYCQKFNYDRQLLDGETYYILKPNTKNPYKQLYVYN